MALNMDAPSTSSSFIKINKPLFLSKRMQLINLAADIVIKRDAISLNIPEDISGEAVEVLKKINEEIAGIDGAVTSLLNNMIDALAQVLNIFETADEAVARAIEARTLTEGGGSSTHVSSSGGTHGGAGF
ncbi:MAG: YwqI/YxiC family protein [Peptococcaceae bacterium]|nr:YwqI/YxiC family protein [Peptococcaceae bacterium]